MSEATPKECIEWLRMMNEKRRVMTGIEPKTWYSDCADTMERESCEVSNLKLANEEARKTIDRLNELIPREANHGGFVLEELEHE